VEGHKESLNRLNGDNGRAAQSVFPIIFPSYTNLYLLEQKNTSYHENNPYQHPFAGLLVRHSPTESPEL
jgi:hypothetical protein